MADVSGTAKKPSAQAALASFTEWFWKTHAAEYGQWKEAVQKASHSCALVVLLQRALHSNLGARPSLLLPVKPDTQTQSKRCNSSRCCGEMCVQQRGAGVRPAGHGQHKVKAPSWACTAAARAHCVNAVATRTRHCCPSQHPVVVEHCNARHERFERWASHRTRCTPCRSGPYLRQNPGRMGSNSSGACARRAQRSFRPQCGECTAQWKRCSAGRNGRPRSRSSPCGCALIRCHTRTGLLGAPSLASLCSLRYQKHASRFSERTQQTSDVAAVTNWPREQSMC